MRNRQKSKWNVIQALAVSAGVLLEICAAGAGAQSFPNRPVRYIMPLPAGSETDLFARVLARELANGWSQQVIVDNRPGAGTTIGTDIAAKAAADGHTMLHAIGAHAVNPALYARLSYDTLMDFACITQIGNIYAVLVAHPSLPVKNVEELIALAKAQPGKIVYATGGSGTPNHINSEALRLVADIDIVHIPYKGSSLALQDLLPGRVPLLATVVVEALPYIRSGKVRPIVVTNPKRAPSLPDVPTVHESLPAYRSGTGFWALLARAGTPLAVLKQLHSDVIKAMQATALRERLAQMDIEPVGSTPAQCDAFLRAQVEIWVGLVRASGARVD